MTGDFDYDCDEWCEWYEDEDEDSYYEDEIWDVDLEVN